MDIFVISLKNSNRRIEFDKFNKNIINYKYFDAIDKNNIKMNSEIIKENVLEYSEQDIAGREGKQILADAIKDALNIFLEDKEGFGGVEGIHFTSFVLQ